jgi:hypothetical protein
MMAHMKQTYRGTRAATLAALMLMEVALLLCVNPLWARGRNTASGRSTAADNQLAESVDLFQAMKTEVANVQLIPKDAKQATVVIKNNSNRPLRIKLPEAFAGVPVLAQVGGDAGRGVDRGGAGDSGINQSFGGGMGMGGMGMGGMGMMGGMFNVAPEAIRKIKVATVCLEHGKPDPNPRVPYEIRPIESYTQDRQVIELCKMLGSGKIDQQAAQAAAWHLTDGLSWQQLASKVKIQHLNGSTELYFTQRDLQRAHGIVAEAARRAASAPVAKSLGEIQTALPDERVERALR